MTDKEIMQLKVAYEESRNLNEYFANRCQKLSLDNISTVASYEKEIDHLKSQIMNLDQQVNYSHDLKTYCKINGVIDVNIRDNDIEEGDDLCIVKDKIYAPLLNGVLQIGRIECTEYIDNDLKEAIYSENKLFVRQARVSEIKVNPGCPTIKLVLLEISKD